MIQTKNKMYQFLMPHRVNEILIVSSPYDSFIMEEDGGLIEHVFTNFRGVSLIEPPKFTTVSKAEDALKSMDRQHFDLVVIMPRFSGMDVAKLAEEIKTKKPDIPIVLLVHSLSKIVLV